MKDSIHTSSDALVTSSDALVTTSNGLQPKSLQMGLQIVGSSEIGSLGTSSRSCRATGAATHSRSGTPCWADPFSKRKGIASIGFQSCEAVHLSKSQMARP